MSQTDHNTADVKLFSSTDQPAIGLVVANGNAESVANEIIHARRHGHQVIVTGPQNGDWQVYARALDAICLDDEEVDYSGDPRTRLAEAARRRGYPGILFHSDDTGHIDLDRSVELLYETDEYAVEAATEAAVDSATHVLAGIPAYNEGNTIGAVVEEVSKYVDEVLVVDDGSSDDTAIEAKAAGATVVQHETNRGYGAALQTIFKQAHGGLVDHLVILDADSQHDPSDIPELIAAQETEDAEIVIGSRFVDGGETNAPMYRHVGLFIVNTLTNLGFGLFNPKSWIRDTQCGFRAYSAEAIESLANADDIGEKMSASTDILNHGFEREYNIAEVGTTVDYDVERASTQHPLSHGYSLVRNIVRIAERKHPLPVLGVPGFLSWFIGLIVAHWMVTDYITTGSVALSLVLVSGLFVIGGLMLSTMAVVLHVLVQSDWV